MTKMKKDVFMSFYLEKLPEREPRGIKNLVIEYDKMSYPADIVQNEFKASEYFSQQFGEEIEATMVSWNRLEEDEEY